MPVSDMEFIRSHQFLYELLYDKKVALCGEGEVVLRGDEDLVFWLGIHHDESVPCHGVYAFDSWPFPERVPVECLFIALDVSHYNFHEWYSQCKEHSLMPVFLDSRAYLGRNPYGPALDWCNNVIHEGSIIDIQNDLSRYHLKSYPISIC